jgi:hypothetical protein
MARLLTAGFETGSLQELNGETYGTATIVTLAARTGARSLSLLGGIIRGGVSHATHVLEIRTELFIRVAFKISPMAIVDGHPFIVFDRKTESPVDGTYTLYFDPATQTFDLYGGAEPGIDPDAALIARGSTAIRADIWYILEMHLEIDTAEPYPRPGTFTLKINGAEELVGRLLDVVQDHSCILFAGPWGNAGGAAYFDDLAINDTSGAFQNSWIGLGGVTFKKPNGDGATTEWTPSTGSDHFALVDEVPANTSDFVQGQDDGDLELFDIEATSSYVTAINVVQPVAQAAIKAAGSRFVRDVVQVDGTDYPGSVEIEVSDATPNYTLLRGETYYENPDGVSGALTAGDLDALQVGWEIPLPT